MLRPWFAAPGAVNPAPLADRSLIVRFKGDLTADKLTRMYRAADTSAGAVDVISADLLKWDVPAGKSVADFADSLEYTGQVEYAEPNYLRQLAAYTPPAYVEPNDPAYADERTMELSSGGTLLESYRAAKSWWLRDVHAVAPSGGNAWKIGYTGTNISGKYPLRVDGSEFKVAVIDTGIYLDHPDRSPYMVPAATTSCPWIRRWSETRSTRTARSRRSRTEAASLGRSPHPQATGRGRSGLRTIRWSARTRSTGATASPMTT